MAYYSSHKKRTSQKQNKTRRFYLESREADRLTKEIQASGEVTTRQDLNDYIASHKVASRYPHISGSLTLRRNHSSRSDVWTYRKGIKPSWYGQICNDVVDKKDVSDQLKFSHPIDFKSYK